MKNRNELRKKALQVYYDLSGGNTLKSVMRLDVAKKLGIKDFNDLDLLDINRYLEKQGYLETDSNIHEAITFKGIEEVENCFPHFKKNVVLPDDLQSKTEDELLAMRKDATPNAYVSGSIYHRIGDELERRHRKNMEEALQKPYTTIDIVNHGNNTNITGNTFEYRNVVTKKISDISDTNRKNDSTNSRVSPEPLFQSKQPDSIGTIVWFISLPVKVDRFVFRYVKNKFLRRFIICCAFILILILLIKGYFTFWGNTGHFEYKPSELSYASESYQASTTIEVLFQGEVTNISSSPRYLNNFVGIIWKNTTWDSTWDYIYSTDINDVYTVEGATSTLITLPISFAPNETKTLQWRFTIDASNPNVMRMLSEQQCQGDFCWNKGQLSILMADSRGNIFDENGVLQSQKVIDDWWVLPDNQKLTDMFSTKVQLGYDIFIWKIREHLLSPY